MPLEQQYNGMNRSQGMNQDIQKTLWAAADKLRANMDAAEYKHVVLGLIFLKYKLSEQMAKGNELDAVIRERLGRLGYAL